MSSVETSSEAAPPMEVPPQVHVMELSSGVWTTQVVYVVAKLGVCDLLGDGARTLDELASAVEARPERLRRLLRAAAGLGLVQRPAPDTYEIGPLGHCLRTVGPKSVRHFAIMNGEEHYQYWGGLLDSMRSDDVAFDRIFGQSAWSYFDAHPEAGETFNRAMSDLARNVHIPAIAQFDFSPYSTVMDIAGGTGTMLSFVLQSNPHLRGILFDRAEVVAQAPEVLQALGVEDRCDRVAGDYHESIPPGADVYMVSLTLQDLADDDALTLLRNVRAAMGPESRFVGVELVNPDGDEFHLAKLNDLNMMLLLGGRIREEHEFRDLYERAGLRLEAIVGSPSPMSLVVGAPAA